MDTLEDKKGEDIVLLNLEGIADFTDYFVICTGTSDRMLASLSQATVEQIKKQFGIKGKEEGMPKDGWLVVDFGSVILHLFSPDQREYYHLEELWEKGKVMLRVQ